MPPTEIAGGMKSEGKTYSHPLCNDPLFANTLTIFLLIYLHIIAVSKKGKTSYECTIAVNNVFLIKIKVSAILFLIIIIVLRKFVTLTVVTQELYVPMLF